MVHARFTFPSRALGRNTAFHILLPRPQSLFADAQNSMEFEAKKCVWMFHGVGDDAETVLNRTDIAGLCDELDCIVILPSVENSFCLDAAPHQHFRSYLTEELFPYIRRLFSLSRRREDHIIGGISMGGYGACSIAFQAPELFSRVFCLSGALDMRIAARFARACGISLVEELTARDALSRHPDWDLCHLLRELAGRREIPAVWLICSEMDAVFKSNLLLAQEGQSLGLPIELHRAEGLHDWSFWRENLPAALRWALA